MSNFNSSASDRSNSYKIIQLYNYTYCVHIIKGQLNCYLCNIVLTSYAGIVHRLITLTWSTAQSLTSFPVYIDRRRSTSVHSNRPPDIGRPAEKSKPHRTVHGGAEESECGGVVVVGTVDRPKQTSRCDHSGRYQEVGLSSLHVFIYVHREYSLWKFEWMVGRKILCTVCLKPRLHQDTMLPNTSCIHLLPSCFLYQQQNRCKFVSRLLLDKKG